MPARVKRWAKRVDTTVITAMKSEWCCRCPEGNCLGKLTVGAIYDLRSKRKDLSGPEESKVRAEEIYQAMCNKRKTPKHKDIVLLSNGVEVCVPTYAKVYGYSKQQMSNVRKMLKNGFYPLPQGHPGNAPRCRKGNRLDSQLDSV